MHSTMWNGQTHMVDGSGQPKGLKKILEERGINTKGLSKQQMINILSTLVKNLQDKKLTVKSMSDVAKVTVDAMRVFSTHPKPDERTMMARDLIARFPKTSNPRLQQA